MNKYEFYVRFVCGKSAVPAINNAISNAMQKFNSIKRKNYKKLIVSIQNGELKYELTSAIQISNENLLRCTQYFSKALSKESIMGAYVMPNRLCTR